jgi:hypothetical protein
MKEEPPAGWRLGCSGAHDQPKGRFRQRRKPTNVSRNGILRHSINGILLQRGTRSSIVNPVSPLIQVCIFAPYPATVAMRRHSQIFLAAGLIGWMGCCLFFGHSAAAIAAESLPGAVGRFDRAALQKELSQPLKALEKEPTEELRAHVQRLGDLHFSLQLAVDVSPEERRALSEQILTRVGQVGLVIRQRMLEPRVSTKSKSLPAAGPGRPPRSDLVGLILDNSGLLLRLLGGLFIAFALGYLARELSAGGATQAVVRSERRAKAPTPVLIPSETPSDGRAMTLEEIRKAVDSGCTVLLQMGYEITPDRRHRFLALAREAQEILRGIEGQTYTVWEDPGHPSRFYELLVCRRLEVLDLLASSDGPLPKLAEEIEACRVPSGFSLHRAWLEALPDALGAPQVAAVTEDSLVR